MRGFWITVAGLFFCLPHVATAKDMTFDIIYQNHTNVVVADGVITAETPNDFRDFLDSEPFDGFNFLIDLNSPGGNLWGGMELGRMIRAEGLTAASCPTRRVPRMKATGLLQKGPACVCRPAPWRS